ncbi:NADH:ubiquinone oxidoreductase 18 kDa subunit [Raphidocelis subcapitata]|uniref:NADH:ubiquinone oxidoreductase 18 kDa subunit n=1 Tax=Raphidocelis subcapitata TaxID=307507 RepID=A0A2V0P7V9_9CHLO|nr:NADH:ubiquinone oxidoreductase 18 kDa subunit [Raphidocelis subcapitata]|eukprot:GBF95948.1 NADH:ubiquinone oxidoreductase 18 kDa subunit [Raphidocelis subcapitata]
MLARLARALPAGLRASPLSALQQQAAAFSDLNLSDRATLKKFVGIEDLLGREADARGTLASLLQQLRDAVGALPADADYRRAIEATVAYRLKVLEANDSDAAVEEVLDAHLEELILEAREEINLVPIMAEQKPWDVPADSQTPVYDYTSADAVLGGGGAPK